MIYSLNTILVYEAFIVKLDTVNFKITEIKGLPEHKLCPKFEAQTLCASNLGVSAVSRLMLVGTILLRTGSHWLGIDFMAPVI